MKEKKKISPNLPIYRIGVEEFVAILQGADYEQRMENTEASYFDPFSPT